MVNQGTNNVSEMMKENRKIISAIFGPSEASIRRKKPSNWIHHSGSCIDAMTYFIYIHAAYICEESGAQRLTDAEIKLTPIRTIAQQYKILPYDHIFSCFIQEYACCTERRERKRDTHTERVRWRAREYINFKMYNSDSIDWVNYVTHSQSHSFLSRSVARSLSFIPQIKSYTWFYSRFVCYDDFSSSFSPAFIIFFFATKLLCLMRLFACIHAEFHLSLFLMHSTIHLLDVLYIKTCAFLFVHRHRVLL